METKMGAIEGMTGCYNSHSLPQLTAIESSISYIEEGINMLDINSSLSTLIIVDYGSSQGANSMHAMQMIIKYLKESKKYIGSPLIVHNDLPTNNWVPLFEILSQDNSYFGLASGRSFYDQCLPSNSVSIAYSSIAIHWLSKKPCNLSNHCVATFGQGDELEAFKRQAYLDYAQFLEHRSREIMTGGVLILVILSLSDEGKRGLDQSLDLLYKCAQKLLMTEEELLNYTIPKYVRSINECVNDDLFQKYSFQYLKSDCHAVPSEFYKKWQEGKMTLDQAAEAHTGFMRSWSESALRQTLCISEKRTNAEVEQLLNQFWIFYLEEIKERPHECITGYYRTCVLLKKI